jgi:hypothetical protein
MLIQLHQWETLPSNVWLAGDWKGHTKAQIHLGGRRAGHTTLVMIEPIFTVQTAAHP